VLAKFRSSHALRRRIHDGAGDKFATLILINIGNPIEVVDKETRADHMSREQIGKILLTLRIAFWLLTEKSLILVRALESVLSVLELVGCWVFIVAWLEVKKKSCFGVKQRGPSQNPASKG